MIRTERYFHYAATIRWCLEYNREDYEFARKGGRITYLVDANIVRFFMRPADEAMQHLGALGRGAQIKSNAMITAEFMLSRELAGQRGAPAFIAPGHAEDISDIIGGIAHAANETRKQPDGKPLDALARDIEANRIDADGAIRQLAEIVPEVAEEVARYLEAQHLKRVYDEELVRPLASHRNATSDILDVDTSRQKSVTEWIKRIQTWAATVEKERKAGVGTREASPAKRDRRRIMRDARVLVQLEKLAADADPDCRYVLITADTLLFDTYARWYWDTAREQSPRPPFLLRLPLQYSPILNLSEMPNGLDDSLIVQTSRSLDPLFEDLRRVDRDYPNSLSLLRTLVGHKPLNDTLLGFFGFNLELNEATQDMFAEMRKEWHDTFARSNLINVSLLNRRTGGILDRIVRLLQDRRDFLEALRDALQRTILDLEQSHLAFSTSVNIRLLHRSVGPQSSQDALRTPTLIRAAFPRILGEIELQDALDRLSNGDAGLLAQVTKAIHKLDFETYFFAACVAHRCGLWHGAFQYTGRARDFIGDEPHPEVNELDFLRANSARNALRSKDSLDIAADALHRLVKDAETRNDHFGLARALCEQAAFYLVILFADALDLIGNLEQKDIALSAMPGIHARSAEAIDRMVRSGGDKQLAILLSIRAAANVLAADLYVRVYADDRERRIIGTDDDMVAAARKKIDTLRDDHPWTFIVELEKAMLSFVRNESSPERTREEFAALKARAKGAGVQMTSLDERELEDFEHRVSEAIRANVTRAESTTAN